MPRGQHQPDRNVLQLQQESTREEDKIKRRTKAVEDEQAETNVYRGSKTTTTTSSEMIVEFEIFEGESFAVEAKVEGETRDGANRGEYFLQGGVSRSVGGSATITGQATTAYETAGAAAWNAIFTVAGNFVKVSAGDPGGATVDWHAELKRKRKAPRTFAADLARTLI